MTIINKGIFDTADVFLRQTGNDWPTAQVLSTSDITEGTNLYFTNARVNAAVSGNLALKANISDLTSANVSELTNLYYTNARVYSNVIALLPTLAGSGIAIQANGQISANAAVVTFASISQFLTTSNVAEGSNLYYTNARVNSFIQGNLVLKANVTDLTTANVAELTNLYYTNARVNSFIQGNLATKANVTDLTTANIAELTNLYYTNTRVYSNVIALLPTLAGSGITIQANGQISAAVSGTVSLAGLTTSNLAEGTNLYYTNTRAVSAFTEGSGIAISSGGVISARGDSAGSGLFNSGIQLVGNILAQSTFSNVKVFSFAEGNTFIGYSFHVTNITSNVVYLTGRHVFNSNTTLFANLLEMPVGASMEVFRKPQVFVANDIIQIQGFDQNRNAVSNGISSYLSYQATTDDTYQRAGNTITGNTLTTIYQTVGRVSIFESINLVNLSPNVIYGTVIVTDGSDNLVAYLAANLAIPAYASVDVCEYPKTLLDDYKVKVQKSDNFNPLSVFTSSKFTQSFAVTPSSTNMTESGTITLDLVTTNIVNGTVLYYAITGVSGNINQTDFVTNTSGTVTVQNNAVRLTLQANADLNTNLEGDETFTVVYRKNSNVGTVVATSSSILLRDTSNTTVYTLTSNASTILESTDVLFTLSTVNLPPNTTYYWNTNNISSYFVTSNTGSFVSNANTSYNILLAANAIAAGTTTDFQLRILTGSQTGTVVATSNVITIVDSSLAYMSATGGTIVDSGGYRIHAFTTSANLTISRTGASPALNTIDYLVVAGGAAGGRAGGSMYAGGGGGGAGGALLSNTIVTSTGNTVITVGAGGAIRAHNEWPLLPGGNTTVIFTGTPTIIALGGGGGSHSWPDHGAGFGGARSGGSGGGGNTNTGYPAGAGTPGQGYPGGASSPTSFGGGGGSFAGGGGGAGEAGHYQPTDPVSPLSTTTQAGGNGIAVPWAPASYGTPGPAPGRYFSGGGGGGASPSGSAYILSGGAGGGGAGGNYTAGYPTSARGLGTQQGGLDGGANATINTGGGGGGAGQGGAASGTGLAGTGGSGIVLIRYPYVDPINVTAEGGTIVDSGGYRTHTFTTSGTLNVYGLGSTGNIEYLMVGGGGGGGTGYAPNNNGAGGGGGGQVANAIVTLTATGNYVVTVGGGATGGSGSPTAVGSNSNVTLSSAGFSIQAIGGSSGILNVPLGSSAGGTSGNGYAGGAGRQPSFTGAGGGGGGAGGVGQIYGSPSAMGGDGGIGRTTSIPGSATTYGGGGGGGPGGGAVSYGGPGGGGGRPPSGPSAAIQNGYTNTGGGGMGGYYTGDTGGIGGSGIVVIRYPIV
jgi:hypothetical protein